MLRHVARWFRRAPTFAVVTILTVACALGTTASVFALYDAVEWGARPYETRDRLVYISGRSDENEDWPLSYLDLQSLDEESKVLDVVAGLSGARSMNLATNDVVEHVQGELVAAEYFTALGLRPALGRLFTPEEARAPGAIPVVVLAHELWRTRLGARPEVIGSRMVLNDVAHEVIGVLPAGFRGLSDGADLWLPLGLARNMYAAGYTDMRQFRWLAGVARMREGATVAEAVRELDLVSRRLTAAFPAENAKLSFQAQPLEDVVGGGLKAPLRALLAGALLILLIAGANLAGLFLIHTNARAQEIAVRLALGGAPGRLRRAMAIEGGVLVAIGALLAVPVAMLMTRVLASRGALALPTVIAPDPSWRVIAASVASALACVAMFALVSWTVVRAVERRGLRLTERTGTASGRAARVLSGLTSLEAALAVMLLIGAGAAVRGLQRAMSADLGFRSANVLTARIDLSGERYLTDDRMRVLIRSLTGDLAGAPGVAGVALEGPGYPTSATYGVSMVPEGAAPDASPVLGSRHHVTPGYFRVLGVPLRGGRDFAMSDAEGAERVVIVSETLAQQLWPGEDAVGQRMVTTGASPKTWTVVGVAAKVLHGGWDGGEPVAPDVYFPLLQSPARFPSRLNVLVQSRGSDPTALAPAVRAAVRRADSMLPVFELRPLDDLLAEQTVRPRFVSLLMLTFGGVALALGIIGVYGAVAYRLALGVRAYAIRLALGASREHVLGLVLRVGMVPIVVGLVAGVALAALVLRGTVTAEGTLAPPGTLVMLAAAALLLVGALLAALRPALRVARTAPARVLQAE